MAGQRGGPANTMAHRRTLILGVLIAFVFGIYLGYLLPGLIAPEQAAVVKTPILPPGQTGGNLAGQTPAAPAGQTDPQLRLLEQATRNNPGDIAAWNKLGHWHFDHDRPAEAIKAYESSLRLKADDPDIITDMAIMYRGLDQSGRALELFRKASGIDRKHEQSRFNQGIVLYFDLDRKAEAMDVWKELLRINPRYQAPQGKSLADWIRELS